MEFKLIMKKLGNRLTPEEEIVFSKWYNESDVHKNYFDNVKINYHNDLQDIDIEKGWIVIENKIDRSIKKRPYWKYAVAASIVLLISFAFIFNKSDNLPEYTPIIVNNNIKAGIDKAILTLEDGSDIALEKDRHYQTENLSSNGEELVYDTKDANTSSNVEIAYNYLMVPRGGQFYVKLADGTEVWLNSDSKLKYPVKFIKGLTRQVELIYGEAYFNVSPSASHNGDAFKVNTQTQEIEVLGTEFNVKAYHDEDTIYTTLVEGKVNIDNSITKEILKPKQQSKFNVAQETMEILTVDVYNVTSWRKGIFSFKNKPLKDIMKVLSRWYDAEVIFADKSIEDIEFNGVLSKKQSIEEILSIIHTTNNIAYEINDKIVIFR